MSFQKQPDASNMFNIRNDPVTGIVAICMAGFWDAETAERFHAQHVSAVAECRRRFRIARVLIDCRDMRIQTREITEILADRTMYAPGDKVVVVAANTLTKVAARRNMEVYNDGVRSDAVTSIEEGLSWLSKGH